MTVLRGVRGALVGARLAGKHTDMKLGLHDGRIRLGLACHKTAGGCANFRAIKACPDTADQVMQVLSFAQAGVGARGANLFAYTKNRNGTRVKLASRRHGTGVLAEHEVDGFHRDENYHTPLKTGIGPAAQHATGQPPW